MGFSHGSSGCFDIKNIRIVFIIGKGDTRIQFLLVGSDRMQIGSLLIGSSAAMQSRELQIL